MTAEGRLGFPVGLTVAVAIAFAVLVGLGTWQLQRLAWKQDLLARIAALEAAPAVPLNLAMHAADQGVDVDFRRVGVRCRGLAKAPFLELYSVRNGEAGSRLISACMVERGRSILVDRGFVADRISARPPVDPVDTTPVMLTGVLRKPEPGNSFSPPNTPRRWYTRDIAGMAAALNAPGPASVMLMAETSTNPEWKALTPAPIPADIANRHLEYAITWYGLAAALVGVYAALLLKRRKG